MNKAAATESFDAYSQWFDIPRDRRPPNHYELLGLEVLDSNAERIETAFQKRYALVRRYQVGEHGGEALRVLKELAKAHDCLSDHDAKERYDHTLLKEFPDLVPKAEAVDAEPVPEVPVEQRKIWVIMPAEGRRWGPLVKTQIEQAVSQGKIRSDYYFQQDDWLEPRPVTEFYRNLPQPPQVNLAPVYQPMPPLGATRTAPTALAQSGATYGLAGSASPLLATPKARAGNLPWNIIIPCIAVGGAVVILIPLLVFGLGGDGGNDSEELASPVDSAKRTVERDNTPPVSDRLSQPVETEGSTQVKDGIRVTNPVTSQPKSSAESEYAKERPSDTSEPTEVGLRNWGEPIDPKGDCVFAFDDDGLTIEVPGPSHGLSIEVGRMDAPRLLREVKGDFTATIRLEGEFDPGTTSPTNRVPFLGAGFALMKDDRTYFRLERAAFFRGTTNHYVSWELRVDGKPLRMGRTGEKKLSPDGPVYLRLERRGDEFHASARALDGEWTQLETVRLTLPETLKLGISASNSTLQPFKPRFKEFAFSFLDSSGSTGPIEVR